MRIEEYFERRAARSPEFRALLREPAPDIELALNVNRLRNARGMTQEELAAAAGMKQPRIAEIERGDANPRLETLTRLAVALGVQPWELIAPAPEAAAPEPAESGEAASEESAVRRTPRARGPSPAASRDAAAAPPPAG